MNGASRTAPRRLAEPRRIRSCLNFMSYVETNLQSEVMTMTLLKSEQKFGAGDTAPDFSLKSIDGETYTLESFKHGRFLLVVFMCNHCPYVKQKIQIIIRLQSDYRDRGLAVVGINANDAETYPDDNFENMKLFAAREGINFPYLFDETQNTARAYGAVCTPDPFLFDENRKLVYQGRIDDALQLGDIPAVNDIAEALDALVAGSEPADRFRYSMGCSIKWKIE